MKEGWEQSLNATYRDRKSSNAELVRQEKAKWVLSSGNTNQSAHPNFSCHILTFNHIIHLYHRTSAAENLSRELEEKFNQKLKLATLEPSSFVYDEEEKEEEVNDFPALTTEHCDCIKRFIYRRDNEQVRVYAYANDKYPN